MLALAKVSFARLIPVFSADIAEEPQQAAASDQLMAKDSYEVEDRVWYLMRDGSREAAKVDSVDRTVQPHSYGVVLGKIGSVRETEGVRLRAMTAAEEAAAEAELAKLPTPMEQGTSLSPFHLYFAAPMHGRHRICFRRASMIPSMGRPS